jgi:hypothetical protein
MLPVALRYIEIDELIVIPIPHFYYLHRLGTCAIGMEFDGVAFIESFHVSLLRHVFGTMPDRVPICDGVFPILSREDFHGQLGREYERAHPALGAIPSGRGTFRVAFHGFTDAHASLCVRHHGVWRDPHIRL